LVPTDWLERIVSNFNDPAVIAVCGADGPIEKTLKSRTVFFFVRNAIRLCPVFGLYCLGGTNSAFRKDAFMQVGGYRNLPHSDDADLGFRLSKVGKIRYDRKVFVEFSTRRLEKNGYGKTLWTWLKGDLLLLMGRDIRAKEDYSRQEY